MAVQTPPKTIAQLITAVDAAGSNLATASANYNTFNSTTALNYSSAAMDYAGALTQLSRALDNPTANLHQAGNQLSAARQALNDAQWPLETAGSPPALIPYLQPAIDQALTQMQEAKRAYDLLADAYNNPTHVASLPPLTGR
jgi:hypothetical protein